LSAVRTRLCLLAALTLIAALAGSASPASGGGPTYVLEVTKVVEGDGPTGGFDIEVNCVQGQGGSVFTLDFDAAAPGTPETQVVNPPNAAQTCTIEEFESNGALTVEYACTDGAPDITCVDDQTIEISGDGNFSSAQFTVTNRFEDLVGPEERPDLPSDAGSGPVAADPGFTG
jgi:hypothetical protein